MKKPLKYLIQQDGKTYSIYEKASDMVIFSYDNYADVSKHIKFLNGGGAFDGFSPSFIFISARTSKNWKEEDT